MKKWYSVALVAALLLISVTVMLCNRQSGDNITVIPSDAKAVMAFYPKEMLSEFGITSEDLITLAAKNGIKNCGIDLSSPVYGFICEDGTLAMTFAIENKKDFSKLCESQGLTVTKRRGLFWCTQNMATICFDSKRALAIFSSTEMENRMIEMMKQEPCKPRLVNNINNMKGCLRLSTFMDIIPEKYMKNGPLAGLPEEADLSLVTLNASLNAADKSICIKAGITSKDENVREHLSKIADVSAPISGDLLDMMPESPLLWICGNIKGGKLLEMLRQIPPVRTSLIAMNMCVDADIILRSVDGDVSCAIPSYKFLGSDFLFTATLNDTDFLNKVEDWKTGVSHDAGILFETATPTDFILTYEGIKTFFGVRNSKLYISNSKALATTACQSGGNADRMSIKSDVRKYNLYASLDLKPLVSQYAPYMLMLGANPAVYEAIDKMNRINLKADKQCNFELELTAKDNISNIINALIKPNQSN